MNKLIQQGTLLSVVPTQWNTRIVIDVPGPERAKKYFGEFEWDVPENVMDINEVNDIPVGTELCLEGYVRLSQGKDKGDGRPPFTFKNLIASKLTIVGDEAPDRAQEADEWGNVPSGASGFSDVTFDDICGTPPDVPF